MVSGVVVYGNATEFSGGLAYPSNLLAGSRITVPQPITLTQLSLITRASGPQVRIGLYSDLGGNPNHLIVQTPAKVLLPGRVEIPVPATAIPAGDYWFMAVFDFEASEGTDPTTSWVVKSISQPFANPLPTTFPAVHDSTTRFQSNRYIKGTFP